MSAKDRRAFLLLAAGFTVWSVAFILLYALQALGCAFDWPHHRIILIVAYLLTLAPLAWLAVMGPRNDGEPAHSLSLAAYWANRAAFVAGVLVFLPVTFVTACI